MGEHPLRTRNLFDPHGTEPYRLSRTKLEQFLQCPRCFYLDRRKGIEPPDGMSPTLNIAVDILMKREFDRARGLREPHAVMRSHGIDSIPLHHPDLDQWRDASRGIAFLHRASNFLFFGAVDDVWVEPDGTLIIVDYKAMSTAVGNVPDLQRKDSYKRQLEMYQWLFRQNGFSVSTVGYIVYANADRGRDLFDGKLEFTTTVLPHRAPADWVDDALVEARACLMKESLPSPHPLCPWCAYRKAAATIET